MTTPRDIINSARSLAEAAEFLQSDHSSFGRWALPGLLPQKGTAVIYGQTGSTKTFLSLHLALTMAAGLQWFGDRVRAGTVIYLVSEDRCGVEARAVAAATSLGLSLADVPLEFIACPPIHQPDWANSVTIALKHFATRNEAQVVAVFIDTLGAAFGGRSQDDAAMMTIACDALQAISDAFGCSVAAVHHSGKSAGRGPRGSQVLEDRIDTLLKLERLKSGSTKVTVEKQRNAPLGPPLTYRLAPASVTTTVGEVQTCIVVDLALITSAVHSADAQQGEGSDQPPPDRLPRDTRAALDALRGLANGAGTRIELWKDATFSKFGARKQATKRQAFSAAKKMLLEKNLIAIDGESVRINASASE